MPLLINTQTTHFLMKNFKRAAQQLQLSFDQLLDLLDLTVADLIGDESTVGEIMQSAEDCGFDPSYGEYRFHEIYQDDRNY